MKRLTQQQHDERGDLIWSFNNLDVAWKRGRTAHLIRKGKEIAKGQWVYSFLGGDYGWKDRDGQHLMREGVEIASGDDVESYPDGSYEWDKDGVRHYINKKGTEIKTKKLVVL